MTAAALVTFLDGSWNVLYVEAFLEMPARWVERIESVRLVSVEAVASEEAGTKQMRSAA